MGRGLRRLAPVRPPKGDQSESPDRVHLQRTQQLDQRHRQSPSDHGRDYRKALSGSAGTQLARLAAHVPPGHQRLLVITDPFAPIGGSATSPARSDLPFTLAVNVPAIGVIGYLAGPDVYLFDSYSLANPIGSHTRWSGTLAPATRSTSARRGWWPVSGSGLRSPWRRPADRPPRSVGAARRALGCPPLADYLHAITAPMGVSRFFSDIGDAYRFTTMSFSADPSLCRHPTVRNVAAYLGPHPMTGVTAGHPHRPVVDRGWAGGWRGLGLSGLVYLVLALVLWWGVWSTDPTTTTTCGCGDAARFLWFFEWPAFALTHGHSVLYSQWLFHPTGINLLDDTSVLALGIVLTPVTWLWGPVAAMNVALTLAPALSALSMFALVRRWVGVAAGRVGGRTGLRVLPVPGHRTGAQPTEHRLLGHSAVDGDGARRVVGPPATIAVPHRCGAGRSWCSCSSS